MTLEEVAKRIGVSRPTVYKYETGAIITIPPDRIMALAELFEVSEQFIMGWSDKRGVDPDETIWFPVPDGPKFIEAYKVMSYQDRVTLTEIFQRAYEKLENDGDG